MNAANLRLLWAVVTDHSQNSFRGLSDEALVNSLVNQIHSRFCLSWEEQTAFSLYIRTRAPLIRELLQT